MFMIVAAWTIPAKAQSVITPDLAILNLDELGVYRFGYAYRGKGEQFFPLGWSGFFEDKTGVACEPFGTQNGKSAFLLHSPWPTAPASAISNLSSTCPNRRPTFSCAVQRRFPRDMRRFPMASDLPPLCQWNEAFRFPPEQRCLAALPIRLLCITRVESHRALRSGSRAEQQSRVRLLALGRSPIVAIEGYTPSAPSHPAPPPLVFSNLWSGQSLEVAPPSGALPAAGRAEPLQWYCFLSLQGTHGVLEYQWRASQLSNDWSFGDLVLRGADGRGRRGHCSLANSATLSWRSQPNTAVRQHLEQSGSTITLVRDWHLRSTRATRPDHGRITGKNVALSVSSDAPQVTSFDAAPGGRWCIGVK